jgi:hypothetical protein
MTGAALMPLFRVKFSDMGHIAAGKAWSESVRNKVEKKVAVWYGPITFRTLAESF